MDLHTDLTYIRLLSSHLQNFKQKSAELFAFSHDCEDFSRGRPKQRAFIYRRDSEFFVHCHHCGMSNKFSTFMRNVAPTLYDDYRLQRYKKMDDAPVIRKEVVQVKKPELVFDAVLDRLKCVASLPRSHPVHALLDKRAISTEARKRLYFAPKFFEFVSQYDERFLGRTDEHPRLIIPYFNMHGKVFAFTSRAFGDEKPKYIHTRLSEHEEMIYGLETIDPSKPILVVEGQIDSLFLENCVAVGGASYDCQFLKQIKSNCVIVPDNDFRRNRHVYKQVRKVIEQGFAVALLPEEFPKDINDCVKEGISPETLKRYIQSHTLSGNGALLELAANKRFE